MHTIQKFILAQLITKQRLRYSDLKPTAMEGSKFSYHLRKLTGANLVTNIDNCYTLTPSGKGLAERFELDSLEVLEQPQTVVLIAGHDKDNGWLLAKRLTQPSIGMVGFPKVTVTLGSNLLKRAAEAFMELSGLSCQLSYAGHGYVTQFIDSQLESQVFFHLLEASKITGELKASSGDSVELGWIKSPDWQAKDFIPSMPDLVQQLEKPSPFFVELEYHL